MWAYHIETIHTTIPYGAHAELRRIMTPMNCKVRYFSVGRLENRTVLLTMMKSDVVSLCNYSYRSPFQFPTYLGCKNCARCRTNSSTSHRNSRWSPRFILQSELVPCLSGGSICASTFVPSQWPHPSNGRFGDRRCTLWPLLKIGSCFRQNGVFNMLIFISAFFMNCPSFVDQNLVVWGLSWPRTPLSGSRNHINTHLGTGHTILA